MGPAIWLTACRGPTPVPPLPTLPEGPVILVGPTMTANPDTPLSRRLALELDRPVRLALEVTTADRVFEVAFSERGTTFDVPVLGLRPGGEATVVVRATDDDDRTSTAAMFSLWTAPLPEVFPRIDALAVDPEASEPGYWLVSMGVPNGVGWLAALDPTDLSVAWVYAGDLDWGDVRATERGTLLGLAGGAWEMDLTGQFLRHWKTSLAPTTTASVALPWTNLHHELFPLADGSMLSLSAATAHADLYPLSYDDPTPVAPAVIADDHAVRFDGSGAVLGDLPLSSVLDTARIGFGSLTPLSLGFDWVHANAVVPWGEGGILVSARHQDALVAIDAQGGLSWILGDPSGWDAAFAPYLLTATPGTTWMYHQHGPDVDEQGNIVVFDNRMFTHTPYEPEPDEVPASRVVAYAVDETARTVDELWSWSPPDGPLLSNALGNAAWMPATGHVLADFGFLDGEGDVLNEAVGRGRKHVRILEIDPAQPSPVVDARLWIPADLEIEGVKAYRVVPMPSLYGPEAVVTPVAGP